MTRKDLSQIYYLRKELTKARERLDEVIGLVQPKSQQITGMPFSGGGASNPTQDYAIKITDYADIVRGYELSLADRIAEVDKWRMSLNDTLLAQIVDYRCIKCLKWDEVAAQIGGGNTADGCRKHFVRHISKN